MTRARGILVILLLFALLQPAHGATSFRKILGTLFGMTYMDWDLQQLLRDFSLGEDAITCLEQNAVYDHERMSMLTPADVDSLDQKCNLSTITTRMLKEHLSDIVQRSLDHQDNNGWTALMSASHKGHWEVVGKLLEKGAKVDLQEKEGWTALMLASQDGHMEVVGKLLEKGAKVDLQNKNGFTALMIASQNGHMEVVGKLLENGAKVDLQEEDGWTALRIASQNGHRKVKKLLREHASRQKREL